MVLGFHKYRQSLTTYTLGRLDSGTTTSHGMRRRLKDASGMNLRRFANLVTQGVGWNLYMHQITRTGFNVKTCRRIG